MEIGGHRGQKFKAWYGDKVLNAAVARELMKEKHRPRHNAVMYHGSAVSNWFLSIKAKTLLPNLPNEIIAPSCWNRLSEHQLGTIVENAVAEVNDCDEDAVKDLAAYLVDIVKQFPTNRLNFRSRFKKLGGVVESYQKKGDDDGLDPLFEATARIRNRKARGVARAKSNSEKMAILSLLTKMGVVDVVKVLKEEEEE